MSTVTHAPPCIQPDPFGPDFNGYPDELPLSLTDSCPGDRVVYADRWMGTLDSPSAEDERWLATNPAPFEPTDADWDDYYRWCEDLERRDALRRMADAEYEARARFG